MAYPGTKLGGIPTDSEMVRGGRVFVSSGLSDETGCRETPDGRWNLEVFSGWVKSAIVFGNVGMKLLSMIYESAYSGIR